MNDKDKDEEHLDRPVDAPPAERLHESANHERIIPRVLRNMLVVSVLLLVLRLARIDWVCLRSRGFLRQFPLADARRRRTCRSHRQPEQPGERRLDQPAFRGALRVGGGRCLCYIQEFFPGVSRLSVGLVRARGSPDGRGGVGRIRGFTAGIVESSLEIVISQRTAGPSLRSG
jgi:hypothetical protein